MAYILYISRTFLVRVWNISRNNEAKLSIKEKNYKEEEEEEEEEAGREDPTGQSEDYFSRRARHKAWDRKLVSRFDFNHALKFNS